MNELSIKSVRERALDPAAMEARRAALTPLHVEMAILGDLLHEAGEDNLEAHDGLGSDARASNDGIVALGYVLKVAHELLSGIDALLCAHGYYSAAALVRQLVEADYLAWACSEDLEEAGAWLRSSDEERRARWQPRHLRSRSGGLYLSRDYVMHCELGGHPTPRGIRTLVVELPKEIAHEVILTEALTHGGRIWDHAMNVVGPIQAKHPVESFFALDDHLSKWRWVERLNTQPTAWPPSGG
ncbi:hypothetical protein [Ornithinimicrobium panacihumi]|uniref:hypothetical protein n=1 Tax=Ornithinimicrobium panacihumi TaxID=2008449 RepID=UPI003F889247